MRKLSIVFRAVAVARPAAAVLLVCSLLAGCGGGSDGNPQVPGKVNVVTTFYPLYFLAKEIGGSDAHVVNLVPAGVEPHDWTPKSKDLKIASGAQLFIYNGAGFEGWSDGFLKGLSSDAQPVRVEASRGIALIDSEGETEEDHDHGDHGDHADHDHGATDPHTWVSPKSATIMAGNIRDAFVQADPDHKAAYDSRYAQLAEKLRELDEEYAKGLAPSAGKDIVVSHQAFAYLCRDYGLRQVSVMGLSPEAEPRSQDIAGIIRYIEEHQIPYIFFEQLASGSLAEVIAKDTGARPLVLNPLEGLTPDQEQAGEDYFSLMRTNLQNLRIALE